MPDTSTGNREIIIYDYSFILTEWHINNLIESLYPFLMERINIKEISNNIIDFLQSSLKISYDLYSENTCRIIIENHIDSVKAILKIEIEEDKIKEIYSQVADRYKANKHKGIKVFFIDNYIAYNVIKKSKRNIKKFIFSSLEFILSLSLSFFSIYAIIKKMSFFPIAALSLILFFIFILDKIFDYKDKKKIKLILDNDEINNRVNFLYSVFLLNQKNKDVIKKWKHYFENLKNIKNSIEQKSTILKNILGKYLITDSKKMINNLFTKNSEVINTISSYNDKITTSNKSISELIAAISSNVDMEVSQSKDTIGKIKKSKDILETCYTVAKTLYKNSEYIAVFMNTIEEISNKIHILSLNASVTAARSGEAGEPFNVVAKEIRKLSDNVKVSISDMTNKSHVLKKTIEEVIEYVSNVNKEINDAYEDITLIINKFEGIYLSLNVIDRKAEMNIGENTKLINLMADNIKNDKNGFQDILQSLDIINVEDIKNYMIYIIGEMNKINTIGNKILESHLSGNNLTSNNSENSIPPE